MKIKIGFTGDMSFSEYSKDIYKNKENLNEKIYEFLNENDYNVFNFESPITDYNVTLKSALAHKSSPETLKFIKDNFNKPILSIANNHMMDYGKKGLLDTVENINKENIPFIGAGKNESEATDYIIVGDKVKIGIIAFQYKNYFIATKETPGTAHDKHIEIIQEKIKELKEKTDWVVVVYHGGEEFLNFPMPYTRRKLKKLLKLGADIVVAHHPHTVQGYEKIKNKTIFYSLGNFIFDTDFQRAQYGTDKGLLLSIEFTKDNYTYKTLPIKKDRSENTILTEEKNYNFIDVKPKYRKKWKKEISRLTSINKNKKKLREYRKSFIISDLSFEEAKCDNIIPFDELTKKYEDIINEKRENIKKDNLIVRRTKSLIRKLKEINYKKNLYKIYAKIFNW